MEKFSINTLTSGKKEMKRVREYLRNNGFKVQKRKDRAYPYYLSNNNGYSIYEGEFRYEALMCGSELGLTLPKDWDKLAKIIKDKPVKDEFKEGDWVYVEKADYGCLSVNYKIGLVTNKKHTNGMSESDPGINIILNNTVWRVSGAIRKATPAEVQSHLESELKERGFNHLCEFTGVRGIKKGEDWIISVEETLSSRNNLQLGLSYSYQAKTDTLYNYGWGLGVVYEKGVFATLKETVPEVCGYELERDGGTWKFGCVEFDLPLIDRLRTVMSEAGITEITIKDEYKVTKSQIEEVYNYVESN